MGKIDMSKDFKLQRQKGVGGIGNQAIPTATTTGPHRGPSLESQQSKCSLSVPPGSRTASPLLHRQAVPLIHQQPSADSGTGGTHRSERRETFKWSGVTVSFDAESVKIENEVNGGPPGIKKLGKEVQFPFLLLV
jgi:hypothetical protein